MCMCVRVEMLGVVFDIMSFRDSKHKEENNTFIRTNAVHTQTHTHQKQKHTHKYRHAHTCS